MCACVLNKATAQRLRAELRNPAEHSVRIREETHRKLWTLTASRCVPGCPVYGAVFFGEILRVADPSVSIGHQAVGGGVREGQPAEDVVIWGGGWIPSDPLGASFIVGEGHYQLAALEVTAKHEGDLLHPRNQSPSLQGNLQQGHGRGGYNVISAIISVL